ncbi:hypothetical protein RCL1_002197 [Eukaryota sp. TZLM3-RCL]
MYALSKIDIAGVRSFRPPQHNDCQTIDFKHPLTIILGSNGSGKTTVIESLRYACTGDPPPSTSRGQRFINDPRLSNATDALAKITVWFRDLHRDSEFGITRTMKVTVKAGKYSFAKIESILSSVDNGNRTTTPSNHTEVTEIAMQKLSLNKALIDYVIFCHQDDNTWPFDDDKTVQDLFDKIFASQKFTAALDHLKKHTTFLKQKKLELSGKYKELIERRKRFDSFKDSQSMAEKEIAKIEVELSQLSKMIDSTTNSLNKLNESVSIAESCHVEVQKLEAKANSLVAAKEGFADIPVIGDASLEQLNLKLSEIPEQRGIVEQKLKNLIQNSEKLKVKYQNSKAHYESVAHSLASITEKTQNLLSLELEIINLIKSMEEVDVTVDVAVKNFQDSKISIEYFTDILPIIQKMIGSCRQSKERIRLLFSKSQEDLNSVQNEMHQNQRNLDQEIYLIEQKSLQINQSIKRNHDVIRQLKSEISRLSNVDSVELLEKNLIDSEYKLKEHLKNENLIKHYSQNIEVMTSSIINLKQEKRKAEEQFNLFKSLEMKQGMLQSNLTVSTNQILKISQNYELVPESAAAIDELHSSDFCNQKINQFLKQTERQSKLIGDLSRRISDISGHLSLAQLKLKELVNSEKKLNTQIQKFSSKFDPNIDLLSQISSLQDQISHLKSRITAKSALITSFDELLSEACSSESCPLCQSKLTKKRMPLLEEEIQNKKVSTNQEINELVVKLSEFENQLANLEELKSSFLIYSKCLEELKPISGKKSELLESINNFENELTELKNDLIEAENQKSKSLKIINGLNQAQNEAVKIAHISQELASIQSKMIDFTDISHPDEFNDEISNYENSIAELTYKLNQFKEIHVELLNAVNLANSKVSKVKAQLSELKEKQSKMIELENLIVEAKKEEQSVLLPLDDLRQKKSSLAEKYQSKINSAKKEVDYYSSLVQKSSNLLDNITSLIAKEDQKRSELVDLQSKSNRIDQVKSEYLNFESNYFKSVDEISNIREEISRLKNSESIILLNIQMKQTELALSEVAEEISIIQNSQEYELYLQLDRLILEKSKMIEKVQNQKTRIDQLHGRKSAQMQNIDNVNRQLNSRDFSDLFLELKEILIDVEAVDAGIKDTTEYMELVNQAIIDYHKAKLLLLNQKICQLWQQTYHGKDIDSVQLETDTEIATSTSTRKYKYRVIFRQGGVSVDMRGQSSAGQKVLASIIIRLALAETFGVRSNFLTLDEPSANLDIHNAKGLANSLAKLTCSENQNLQLVLITHDADFIKYLLDAYQNNSHDNFEILDEYYEVYKNQQGYSEIRTKPLSLLRNLS